MNLEELNKYLNFEDGKFHWKISLSNRAKLGDTAGTLTSHGYKSICVNRKRYYEHSLVFLYHYGYIPKMIDHINGNKLDNRIENLRECNSFQNSANKAKTVLNTSGHKGVHKQKNSNKWRAQIQIGSTRKHLGYFDNILEAKKAYDNEAILHYKEFARI
jgi:hypothetical protein